MRQHYLDELTLDEMAVLYRVHRATVAKWLSAARSTLLGRTRDILQRELGLNANEADSIVALVRSRLDLSAGIFMSTVTPSDE